MPIVKVDLNDASGAEQIGILIREAIAKKRLEIAMTALQQVAVISPVYTGRLRMGWDPSVNVPSEYIPPEGVYPMPDISIRATQAWENAQLADTLYITNNVPYAVMVNNGTVKMAPRRFVERTISVISQLYSG